MFRVLAGAVTNAPPEILRAHLDTIRWQQVNDVAVDLCYIADPALPEESAEVLSSVARVLPAKPKPAEAEYAITSTTHHWTIPTFHWLAREKQRLLDLAVEERYDAVWLVDSDLLCGPDTLASLLASEKPVVSAVFWTRWTPGAAPLPQVWLRQPYELDGKGWKAHEFLEALANRQLVRVGGLGACTLIRTDVLDRVGYWPLVEGLPSHGMWQGEDRHFCIRAQRAHVELWADAWPDIFHVYRPEDVEKIPDALERLNQSFMSPRMGDLVSFTVEPCEEPALADYKEHVRGRLGQLKLLTELEQCILDMMVGDERLVSIQFPHWYPIPQYRGRKRTLRVRLIGAKPYHDPVN